MSSRTRRPKLASRLLRNYMTVFVITTGITLAVIALLAAVNSMNRTDNLYSQLSAANLMNDNYLRIPVAEIEANGGSLQVVIAEAIPAMRDVAATAEGNLAPIATAVNAAAAPHASEIRYQVVRSAGENPFAATVLSAKDFTRFLTGSATAADHITIAYNPKQHFWLIVSLPIQVRIVAGVHLNLNSPVQDQTLQMLGWVALGYLTILLFSALLYARMAAASLTRPLGKLAEAALQMREGDYSIRAQGGNIQELDELAQAFNRMAAEIERQTELAERSEQNRRSLLLDLSHDLKNPLATIVGYSEHLLENGSSHPLPSPEADYVQIIHNNGIRASRLVTDLSELSTLASPSFHLERQAADWGEFLRQEIIAMLPELLAAGLQLELALPEEEIRLSFDSKQMSRALFNLLHNAAVHAEAESVLAIQMERTVDHMLLTLENGNNASSSGGQVADTQSFVAGQASTNLNPATVGLGLAIVERIVHAHGGTLELATATGEHFTIRLRLPLQASPLSATANDSADSN